jgi:hypothetical protein
MAAMALSGSPAARRASEVVMAWSRSVHAAHSLDPDLLDEELVPDR